MTFRFNAENPLSRLANGRIDRSVGAGPARALVFLSLLLLASPAFPQSPRGGGDVLGQLELRSIFAIRDNPQFSVHDPVRDMSFWIALNESRHGVEVTEYDAGNDQIVVRYQDRSRRLGLSELEIAPLETSESDGSASPETSYPHQRSDLRNPEERRRHILETWEQEIERNASLREIDEHMGEYYREFRNLRQSMWHTTDHDSPEFQALRERRRELREEAQVLHRLTQREIEDNAAFEDIDRGALLATLRYRHMPRNSEPDN